MPDDVRNRSRWPSRHRPPLAPARPGRPPLGDGRTPDLGRRLLIAVAVVLVAGATALVVSLQDGRGESRGPGAAPVAFPTLTLPTGPATVLPAAVTSSRSAEATTPPAATRPATRRPPQRPAAPAAVVDLNIGDEVGLEVRDMPGVRVRHRDFLGRAEPIGSSSSALDKADAVFRVRRGLGNSGCVSLESVNFPGYFLRHRDFVIRLERRDGSYLFDQDGTFCPQPVRDGSAVTLASINFPDRAVALHPDATLHLDPGPPTAFVVRPPL